jgi:hypothetical protein
MPKHPFPVLALVFSPAVFVATMVKGAVIGERIAQLGVIEPPHRS